MSVLDFADPAHRLLNQFLTKQAFSSISSVIISALSSFLVDPQKSDIGELFSFLHASVVISGIFS